MVTPTPHPNVMTASARAFHRRHFPESSTGGHEGYPSDHSSGSDDGGSHGIGKHDNDGFADETAYEPPIIEENAFAHLMEAHFGVHSGIEGDTSTRHDNAQDEDGEWDELDSLACTPLYADATTSRYFIITYCVEIYRYFSFNYFKCTYIILKISC